MATSYGIEIAVEYFLQMPWWARLGYMFVTFILLAGLIKFIRDRHWSCDCGVC